MLSRHLTLNLLIPFSLRVENGVSSPSRNALSSTLPTARALMSSALTRTGAAASSSSSLPLFFFSPLEEYRDVALLNLEPDVHEYKLAVTGTVAVGRCTPALGELAAEAGGNDHLGVRVEDEGVQRVGRLVLLM
ncbi:hypothetical protein DL769_007258 [Monosporascus sp. CRB-8-3]|nr:hypothetical protein DL769_007258 [Monosporascus sp. CRB-8-3]